jgi:hypothetical protein
MVLLAGMLVVAGGANAANPSATLDQCANGPAASPTGCNPNTWVNGNLGASKAHYLEGDSVPYRMTFLNLVTFAQAPSLIHHLTIEWDTTKGGKHALDYLTSWNQTVTTANPCAGVSGCTLGSPSAPLAIPSDPQVTGAGVSPIAGNFNIWGGTLTSITATPDAGNANHGYRYSNGTGFAGDKSASIQINFTATVANPVIAWGGHIATRLNWGTGSSAVAIAGSPFHMRLIDLDGAGGNQDRSLSNDAVTFPASITIIKDVVLGSDPQDFAFTETASSTPLLTPSTFSLDDDSTSATPTDTQSYSGITNFINYTFDEGAVSHWSLSFNTPNPCSVTSANGGTQTPSSTGITINLKEGENVTCTFLNTHNVTTPGLSTQVRTPGADTIVGNTDDGTVADGGHIAINAVIYDTATLSGATSDASGNVTYYYKLQTSAALDCTGGSQLGAVKSASGGIIPRSDTTSFSVAGTYEFWAVYAGDGNNSGKTSTCGSETVIVDANAPGLSTQVKTPGADTVAGTTDDGTVADGGHIAINAVIYDTATLSGATSDADSTVTYYSKLQTSAALDCTGGTQIGAAKTVAGGIAPRSDTTSFSVAGTYEFWAVYSGDSNNAGKTSTCGSETVIVDKTQSVTTTQVKTPGADTIAGNTDDGTVADGGHIAIGAVIYDTNNVTGASPSGTVTYYSKLQTSAALDCTGGTQIGAAKTVGVASDTTSFSTAGTYELWAVYVGDGNNLGSSSTCGSETVIVDKNSPTIGTTPNLLPNDSIDVSGLTATAGGILYVELQVNAPCGTDNPPFSQTWDSTLAGDAHFHGNGTYVTTNTNVLVSESETIQWCTSYSGDANNAARLLAADGETIQITFGAPEIVAAAAFGLAIPMLLWGLWNRKRRNAAE